LQRGWKGGRGCGERGCGEQGRCDVFEELYECCACVCWCREAVSRLSAYRQEPLEDIAKLRAEPDRVAETQHLGSSAARNSTKSEVRGRATRHHAQHHRADPVHVLLQRSARHGRRKRRQIALSKQGLTNSITRAEPRQPHALAMRPRRPIHHDVAGRYGAMTHWGTHFPEALEPTQQPQTHAYDLFFSRAEVVVQ
jgi:hypothetical protein